MTDTVGRLIDTGQSPAGGSRIATFRACPFSFALSYRMGVPDLPSFDQAEGTVLHAGLGHHYARRRGASVDADLASPEDAIRETARIVLAESRHRIDPEKIIRTLHRYIEHYRIVEERWEVLSIDTHYDVWIEDRARNTRYRFTPKPDLVVRFGGRVYFVDHKGAARLDAPKQARLYSVSRSVLGQRWAGPHLFPGSFGGVILNMVQRDGERFARPSLDPVPDLVARFPEVVVHDERGIADLDASGLAPRDWPRAAHGDACWTRFGPCPHLAKRCSWGSA